MAQSVDASNQAAPLPKIQKAIRLHGPYKVQLDDIPVPEIEHPDDAIVKILAAGLCGSDLHPYRGHKFKEKPAFVMGHELYGEIVRLGSNFASQGASMGGNKRPKGYEMYRVGMNVIATFSISCLECEYCKQGFTSRCIHSQLLGSPALPGAQAQYIRIPKAGGTLISQADEQLNPPIQESSLPAEIAILLADILPTGYFAALQAFQHPNLVFSLGTASEMVGLVDRTYAEEVGSMWPVQSSGPGNSNSRITFAVIGLGPVGICALVALIDFMLLNLESHSSSTSASSEKQGNGLTFSILAFDLLESRKVEAEGVVKRIKDPRINVIVGKDITASALDRTSQRPIEVTFLSSDQAPPDSCHAVLEVVGHPTALSLAGTLSRPFGIISSVGVHSNPTFPLPTPMLYDKNLSFAFGRCPVRTLVGRSRCMLERRKEAFTGFVDRIVGLDEAKEAYERFEKGEGGKVCFDPWK